MTRPGPVSLKRRQLFPGAVIRRQDLQRFTYGADRRLGGSRLRVNAFEAVHGKRAPQCQCGQNTARPDGKIWAAVYSLCTTSHRSSGAREDNYRNELPLYRRHVQAGEREHASEIGMLASDGPSVDAGTHNQLAGRVWKQYAVTKEELRCRRHAPHWTSGRQLASTRASLRRPGKIRTF